MTKSDQLTRAAPTKTQKVLASLNDKQRNIVINIAIGLGISIIAAVAIYFGKKAVQNYVADKEESKSDGSDKYATWAKRIQNAFDNNGYWGTDEVLLRNALREIPSKEDWERVKKSYKKQFNATLANRMTGELKQTEYDEMLAILNSKPEKRNDVGKAKIYDPRGWARRIHAALSYNWLGFLWGTDEDAIKAVFMDMPTQKAYWDTKKAYQKLYAVNMYNDMKADMDDLHDYLKIIWRKPKT